MHDDLKGLHTALMISVNKDGSLNEEGTRQIVRHNIDRMKAVSYTHLTLPTIYSV